jgi:hypothetical protein
MKYEMKTHSGECGFCGTTVPTHASVCTGCGARWGSKSGNTPEEVYLAGRKHIKDGVNMASIPVATLILLIATGSFWFYLILITIGGLAAIYAIAYLLAGWMELHAAKNLEIAWWRQQ